MPTFRVSAEHIDTCLGCYLTDHHNRSGECLVGIVPSAQGIEEAAMEATAEYGCLSDREEQTPSEESVRKAIAAALEGVDLRHIAPDGGRVNVDPEDDDDGCEDPARVWILITWERTDDATASENE